MDAAEAMNKGVMWLDKDGNILGVNSQFAKDLSYTKADFSRKTIFQVNPNMTLLQWRKTWQELLDHQQVTIETKHMTAGGDIHPVKWRGVLIQAEEANFCFGIVENAQEERQHHRDHLLEITEQISRSGSWEWDAENGKVRFSEGMRNLLNLSKSNQLSINEVQTLLERHLSEPERTALTPELKQAIKTGKPIEAELDILREESASPLRIRFHAKPLQTEGRTWKMLGIIQDISDISGRTENLHLMEYCIDHAYEMIMWVSESGQIEYVNHAARKQLGYNRAELLQMSLPDVEPNFKHDRWQRQWQTLKQQKSIEAERLRQTSDGRLLNVQVWTNYVNFNGKEYCLEFARDLTRKKERDELIELSHYTLDQATDMIYWLDYEGNLKFFNQSLQQKTGYSEAELQQKTIFELFPIFTKKGLKDAWKRMQAGATITNEIEITCKDGSKISVTSVVSLIQHEGTELACAILRDISEQKKKENELQQQLEENEKLRQQLEQENVLLKEEIKLEHIFTNIISKNKKYKRVLQKVEQVADTDATVLILGETGTGKELLAKAIHQLSNRAERPLIKVNCGALPDNLIESELFGHEKGAFTGAYKRKIGRFEAANRGTLFLDEIGELPLDLQVKLLRVLQEQEFVRVGGSETVRVDVRVIAATNRDLEARVREGRFRQDLYYRLNVFPIFNLPLRKRMDDVPLLVRHFVEKFNQQLGKSVREIPQHVLDELLQYDFPGNIRELENIIERGMILSKGKTLTLDLSFQRQTTNGRSDTFQTMEDMQRAHIIEALSRTQGRVSGERGAAKLLNINPKTLTSRMKKLGIDRMDYLKKG